MVARILCCISIFALGQFCLYYWRATVSHISTQKVSDRVRIAAGILASSPRSSDFSVILTVRDLTPHLRGSGRTFRAIRAYYFIVEKIGCLIPAVSEWAGAEMDMCSRYVAVLVDQHLGRNLDCAIQLRGI
jgi:hypothetical protein